MDDLLSTTGLIVGALWGGRKVAGPYLDMVGKNLAEMGDWRRNNALKISQYAQEFAEENHTQRDSQIHPRVAERFINGLSWIDDEVMQRYSGGLLAASLSDTDNNDRALRYLNIVSDMTRNETRLHFLLYRAAYEALRPNCGFGAPYYAWRFRVSAGFPDLVQALFSDHETEAEQYSALREALAGLGQHGLLNTAGMALGADHEHVNSDGLADSEHIVLKINLTELGVLLFLHARGVSTSDFSTFGRSDLPPFKAEEPRLESPTVYEGMI